ncbi:MAG: hypothetical protein ACLU7M_02110 [Mediterraneibacter gnavus]
MLPLIADMQVSEKNWYEGGVVTMKGNWNYRWSGSGKSAVLKLLEEEYHAVVVQLDEVAKALQRRALPAGKLYRV